MDAFQHRLYDASETIYQRILDGHVTDVEAELMNAHLNASSDEEDD